MSWFWVISVVIAATLGFNLGVTLMALIRSGASEDQRKHFPWEGHP